MDERLIALVIGIFFLLWGIYIVYKGEVILGRYSPQEIVGIGAFIVGLTFGAFGLFWIFLYILMLQNIEGLVLFNYYLTIREFVFGSVAFLLGGSIVGSLFGGHPSR